MLVEVELFQLVIAEGNPTHCIVLKEVGGSERTFPIYIGYPEAMAIDRKLKNFPFSRPLTHDLLQQTIVKLGARLEKVVLNDLRDGTYYALLVLNRDGQTVEVDSRPSDAVALAVRFGCKLFAQEDVIQSATPNE